MLYQRWSNVKKALCNVASMLFQRRSPTLYQRYAVLISDVGFCFIFNVEIKLIQNVQTRLI